MKKKILAIIGSASSHSANLQLVEYISNISREYFEWTIFNNLKSLPHFDPEQSSDNPPQAIVSIRKQIQDADGVLICTPEYVFSIPSGLKNLLEWCVSTTVFSDKPVGLICASADGKKGLEELELIMKTIMANFSNDHVLHIQGIKGKINSIGEIINELTQKQVLTFTRAFKTLVNQD